MDIMELCTRNYGRTWTKEMIAALVVKGKITQEQYENITGDVKPEDTQERYWEVTGDVKLEK